MPSADAQLWPPAGDLDTYAPTPYTGADGGAEEADVTQDGVDAGYIEDTEIDSGDVN